MPPGKVVVLIVSGFATWTVNVCDALCGGAEASEAVTVKVNVPAALGVPLRISVCGKLPDGDRESPVGGVPLVTLNATGVTPPTLMMLALYGVPAVPPGRALVVIASWLATWMVNVCDAD